MQAFSRQVQYGFFKRVREVECRIKGFLCKSRSILVPRALLGPAGPSHEKQRRPRRLRETKGLWERNDPGALPSSPGQFLQPNERRGLGTKCDSEFSQQALWVTSHQILPGMTGDKTAGVHYWEHATLFD